MPKLCSLNFPLILILTCTLESLAYDLSSTSLVTGSPEVPGEGEPSLTVLLNGPDHQEIH